MVQCTETVVDVRKIGQCGGHLCDWWKWISGELDSVMHYIYLCNVLVVYPYTCQLQSLHVLSTCNVYYPSRKSSHSRCFTQNVCCPNRNSLISYIIISYTRTVIEFAVFLSDALQCSFFQLCTLQIFSQTDGERDDASVGHCSLRNTAAATLDAVHASY